MVGFMPGMQFWIWAGIILFGLIFWKQTIRLFGIVYIPNDSIGQITKFFAILGKNTRLPPGRVVALKGEAGVQADTLAPGLYFFYWPWQFRVNLLKFYVVPEGKIGIVESRDGDQIPTGRVLGKHIDCDRFQNARAFLEGGGQRGPQMDVVPPGTYRFNTALYSITLAEALVIPEGKVGIVTTLEGQPLPTGEIAGKEVPGHQMFQDTDAFVRNGGFKGMQEQVMLAGRFYVNPRFVSVTYEELTIVPIGHCGVVVAYIGDVGEDVTGVGFKHGNLVKKGQKGVWATPLDPGRYPINPRTHKVEPVPTTNIVLNWATGKSEAHKLDEKLSTITVRSKDGFKFNLDVSQIIHVPREEAPKVIARFGSMTNLVTQVLEPTIGNHFRNAVQGADVIDFLTNREQRQKDAAEHIKSALEDYNVQAVATLIGDIVPPEELMKTLTDRKVAEQRQETYKTQQKAEDERTKFEQAKSEADTRGQVVQASRAAEVAKLQADAAVNKATGEAAAKKQIADGEAYYTETTGEAIAKKTTAVGEAEASVLQKKVNSVGSTAYAAMAIAKDLAESDTKLMPDILVTGGHGEKGGGSILDAFLGVLLGKQVDAAAKAKPVALPPAE
jgi:uncharacterized membrane protein YqiK